MESRLGSLWIRQQSSPDVSRCKTIIRHAMNAGQSSATIMRLVLDQDVFMDNSCPAWKVRQVISKEPSKTTWGYRLHDRLLSLVTSLEQEGLGWCICNSVKGVNEVSGQLIVDPVHTLLVYWHPSTASEGQTNGLFKYYMTLVMQAPIDKPRLKFYHERIKGAMEAGQTSCVISCLCLNQSYKVGESSSDSLACRETRHYLTGAHIVLPQHSPVWVVDEKFAVLIEWIVKTHELSWDLRFCPMDESKMVLDVTTQLYPWALLVIYW